MKKKKHMITIHGCEHELLRVDYDDDLKPWQCLDEQLLLGVVDVISHPAKV